MRATIRALAMVAACCAAAPALALPHIHAIVAHDGPAYTEVLDAVRAALAGRAELSDGGLDARVPDQAVAVVAVGAAAVARWCGGDDPRPLFATLVPSAGWATIVDDGDGCASRTAVWLDQPPARQLAFIRVLLPPLRELGVVYGPESVALRDALAAAAADRQMLVNPLVVGPDDELNGALASLLRRSEALLALPDSAVYHRYNVQSVLLATFRARRPVVGFSESWARAGALAAIYATPTQLGEDLGGVVAGWLETRGALPPARASDRWSIAVNRQVAFSLSVNVVPDAVLQQRLRALLEQRP